VAELRAGTNFQSIACDQLPGYQGTDRT